MDSRIWDSEQEVWLNLTTVKCTKEGCCNKDIPIQIYVPDIPNAFIFCGPCESPLEPIQVELTPES